MAISFSVENQVGFYEKITLQFTQQILWKIKNEYEKKDQEIFHSQWRKQSGYIPHGTRTKTIITIYGKIQFKRHRYRIWKKDQYHFIYLADIALGIEKYQRITNYLEMKIIAMIANGKRYQDISDCFPFVSINQQTINRIIKRIPIKPLSEIISQHVQSVTLTNNLYINIDDTFVTLKNNNHKIKQKIRIVIFHDGYDQDKSSIKKKVLKNLRIFAFLVPKNEKIPTKIWAKKILLLAQRFYFNAQEKEVIISGDGAPWIRSCTKYIPNSCYILDKFHAIRKMRHVFTTKDNDSLKKYQHLKNLFLQGEDQKIIMFLNQEANNSGKKQKVDELKKYFIKNQKFSGISNQKHKNNLGCCIENVISHHIKRLLGYGAKAFNFDIFNKILTIHLAKTNKIDINSIINENFASFMTSKLNYLS